MGSSSASKGTFAASFETIYLSFERLVYPPARSIRTSLKVLTQFTVDTLV
ncbi:hypothetical protein [Paenibacillus sp. FSL M7-1046]